MICIGGLTPVGLATGKSLFLGPLEPSFLILLVPLALLKISSSSPSSLLSSSLPSSLLPSSLLPSLLLPSSLLPSLLLPSSLLPSVLSEDGVGVTFYFQYCI